MTGDTNPLVSIIILNYNGMQFLKDCFDSVLKSTYSNLEFILVDNNSTDESVAFTRENYSQIKVFETGINGGYSRAYNMSFEIAKGKYFILLNNDVTVEPDWIEPLVEVAENDDNIGALQPKLVSMIDPSNFEYAGASGGFMDIYGFPFLRGRVFTKMEKDYGQYDDEVRIFWATGAAMFLRASVLKESGNLDEDFVHHMEEIDLCWRLNLVGYKLMAIPKSKIYHYGGATIKPDSYQKMYWNHRNSIFMLYKNLEKKNLGKIMFQKMILDAMALCASLTGRLEFTRARAIFDAYIWLFRKKKMLRQKRKEVEKIRKVSDEEIFKIMYPKSIAIQFFIKGRKTYQQLMDALI